MTYERAAEILNPEHRETYESLEIVNEACRMGRAALFRRMPEPPHPDGDESILACPTCGSRRISLQRGREPLLFLRLVRTGHRLERGDIQGGRPDEARAEISGEQMAAGGMDCIPHAAAQELSGTVLRERGSVLQKATEPYRDHQRLGRRDHQPVPLYPGTAGGADAGRGLYAVQPGRV